MCKILINETLNGTTHLYVGVNRYVLEREHRDLLGWPSANKYKGCVLFISNRPNCLCWSCTGYPKICTRANPECIWGAKRLNSAVRPCCSSNRAMAHTLQQGRFVIDAGGYKNEIGINDNINARYKVTWRAQHHFEHSHNLKKLQMFTTYIEPKVE